MSFLKSRLRLGSATGIVAPRRRLARRPSRSIKWAVGKRRHPQRTAWSVKAPRGGRPEHSARGAAAGSRRACLSGGLPASRRYSEPGSRSGGISRLALLSLALYLALYLPFSLPLTLPLTPPSTLPPLLFLVEPLRSRSVHLSICLACQPSLSHTLSV